MADGLPPLAANAPIISTAPATSDGDDGVAFAEVEAEVTESDWGEENPPPANTEAGSCSCAIGGFINIVDDDDDDDDDDDEDAPLRFWRRAQATRPSADDDESALLPPLLHQTPAHQLGIGGSKKEGKAPKPSSRSRKRIKLSFVPMNAK
jgi:hypothetical protein